MRTSLNLSSAGERVSVWRESKKVALSLNAAWATHSESVARILLTGVRESERDRGRERDADSPYETEHCLQPPVQHSTVYRFAMVTMH